MHHLEDRFWGCHRALWSPRGGGVGLTGDEKDGMIQMRWMNVGYGY